MFHQLTSFLVPVAAQLLIASCKASLAIAFVLLCRRLLRERLSAAARHVMWLAVLACLLVPVGFDVRVLPPAESAPPAHARVNAEAAGSAAGPTSLSRSSSGQSPASRSPVSPPLASVPRADPATAAVSAEPDPALVTPLPEVGWLAIAGTSLRDGLALLWAVVVVALAAVLAWNLVRYRGIVARATPLAGPALDLLLQCRDQVGLRRQVRLLESTEVPAPAVLGWWSPVLLLPARLHRRLGSSQLRHVYLHELAHVRRHDILTSWLATAAQVLHWFNPLVWYGLRAMRSDMEQACDAEAMRRLAPGEREGYGQTLIGILDACPARLPAHGLGVVESHAQLKERIAAIARFDARHAGMPMLAAMLVLAVTSVAAMQPRAIEPLDRSGPVTGPAPRPDVAPGPATSSRPVESRVAPFTVLLRLQSFDPVVDDERFPGNYVEALSARLRAIPGLVLLTPDSPVPVGPADFEIVVSVPGTAQDQRVVVMPRARVESERTRRRSMLISSGIHPIAYEVGAGDPGFNLDRDIDRLRMTVFPADPSASRELRAKLLDPGEPFDRRFATLGLLLDFDRPPDAVMADPQVVRLGARFAASLPDPRMRGMAWSRLRETESPELPALLARGLAEEGDSGQRLMMIMMLDSRHAADARVRESLEAIARTDPREITRLVARRALGEVRLPSVDLWKDYVLATLADTTLTDAQRIDPFAYPWVAGTSVRSPSPMGEAELRTLGSLLRRADAYTDATMGAAFVLGRAQGPVAREVVIDVIGVAQEGPTALPEVRKQVLTALERVAPESDPRLHAAVKTLADRDPDAGVRQVALSILPR